MDFLNKFLAELIAKFKLANPTIFVIVAAVLTVVKALIDNGTIPLDPSISQWVLWLIALLVGTPTTKFLFNQTPKG